MHEHRYRSLFAEAHVSEGVLARTGILLQLEIAPVVFLFDAGEDLVVGRRQGAGREQRDQRTDGDRMAKPAVEVRRETGHADHLAAAALSAAGREAPAAAKSWSTAVRRSISRSSRDQSPALALVAMGRLRSW